MTTDKTQAQSPSLSTAAGQVSVRSQNEGEDFLMTDRPHDDEEQNRQRLRMLLPKADREFLEEWERKYVLPALAKIAAGHEGG